MAWFLPVWLIMAAGNGVLRKGRDDMDDVADSLLLMSGSTLLLTMTSLSDKLIFCPFVFVICSPIVLPSSIIILIRRRVKRRLEIVGEVMDV